MQAARAAAIAVGIVVVLGDIGDVVRALVVPRPYVGGPIAAVLRPLRRFALHTGRRWRRRSWGEPLLAASEPVLLLVRLALWLAIVVVGFSLIIWGAGHDSWQRSLVASGSSVFTLGFANRTSTVPAVTAFMAAAIGVVIVALQIAYLPTLYDAVNRRETLVTTLESRAGTPAWGPELLARHYLVGIQQNLPTLYADWERWAADVAESHTAYPALLWFRSPHPQNSWLGALTAVMDSGSLLLALSPQAAPAEARLCVRMGFTCLRDIARVLRIPFDPDPRPDQAIRLPHDRFEEAVAHLQAAGVPVERSIEEAWPHFRGWRVNYESIVDALAAVLVAPPAPWLRPESTDDPRPNRPVDRVPDPAAHRQPAEKTVDSPATEGPGLATARQPPDRQPPD